MRPLAALLLAAAFAVAPACRKTQPSLAAGIDLAGMDTAVAPGDDFNAYANGGWLKATPIPADKSSYGIFAILADETRKRNLAIVEEAAKAGSNASGDTRKIADFYASFMDEAAIESKGIAPLKPQFDAIAAIANRRDLARVLGGQLRADVDPLNATNFQTGNLFGVFVTQGLTPGHLAQRLAGQNRRVPQDALKFAGHGVPADPAFFGRPDRPGQVDDWGDLRKPQVPGV